VYETIKDKGYDLDKMLRPTSGKRRPFRVAWHATLFSQIMVVLRDEAGFLADDEPLDTWYPDGFSAPGFAQVFEQEGLWQDLPQPANTASPPTSN